MLEDLDTKPLQGSLYELFKKIIIVHSGIYVLLHYYSFPLKEHVENYRIFQVVSKNPAMADGRETYTGANKS